MNRHSPTEAELRRLNLVLLTIRNVNQLIVKEKNRDRLIKGICENLVENRSYFNAWIALFDESNKLEAYAEAGLGKKFLPMLELFRSGNLTDCARIALVQSGPVITTDPISTCAKCPLAQEYGGRAALAIKLEHEGEECGLLCASIPANFAADSEELSLFEEVSKDIAFALHSLKTEEKHIKIDQELKESERRFRELFENASDGMYIRDLEGNIIMANRAMTLLSGYTLDELTKMNISQFLSESSLKGTMERQRRRIENEKEPKAKRYELQMIKKDGTKRIIEVVTSLIAVGQYSPAIQTIARDITEQKRAHESIRAYAVQVIEAQEAERKRIARDLHDETAQELVSLGIDMDSLVKNDKQLPTHITKRLEELRNRTNNILQGVRLLSQALRPPMLEELGLLDALQWLIKDLAAQYGIEFHFDSEGTPRRLSTETEIAIFRIAQEALNNVGKHALATDVVVKIKYHPRNVELKISDNGRGFELPESLVNLTTKGKLGLMGIQERAKLINGTLSLESKLGKGTTLILKV